MIAFCFNGSVERASLFIFIGNASIFLMDLAKDFSIRECFLVGWQRFQERAWFLVGAGLLMWMVAFVGAILVEEVYQHIEPTRTILDFLSSLLYYWICFGLIVVTLKIVDGKPTTWGDLFAFDRRFILYILGNFLYGLVVTLGIIALIIPGIYLALRYGFFWYAIIDGHKGVFAAFHESARITHGVKWQLVLFGLASMGAILLGFFALGVGVLVAIPVVMLASAHLYRVLLNQAPETLESTETSVATPIRPHDPPSAGATVSAISRMATDPTPEAPNLPPENVLATPPSESLVKDAPQKVAD